MSARGPLRPAALRRPAVLVTAIALLVTGAPFAQATLPASSDALPSDETRRTQSEENAPDVDQPDPIASVDLATEEAETAPLPSVDPAAVAWPKESRTSVSVAPSSRSARGWSQSSDGVLRARPAVPADDADVTRLDLTVLDAEVAGDAGVAGLVVEVGSADERDSGAAVDVTVDYTEFAGAYGGDWASRLELVSLPDCALTTPDEPSCRVQTPVESTNDRAAGTVSARVASESFGVMAVAAAASGTTGNWSATPLAPSASWQVSAQTGDFAWSYPMRVPPTAAGPSPDLALSYSAGSLDGRVASTNNQTSWIGDGWDMSPGYVERTYVPCAQDMAGGNNATRKTGDLCWSTDNATLVLGGSASALVKDAATGAWRMKSDDGSRIERLTGGWNGDNDGEYWKVTTTDGTQYVFGRGRRSATDTTALNSAWTVPVFGNHPGEPCYAAAFASASCVQAWRWNLEYVTDTSGNSMTYFYAAETNSYGRNLGTAVSSYVRGGYLTRIDYGQRAGSETASAAPQRVDFAVAERCLPAGTITCDPAQLTTANAKSWPDVPFDLICASTTTCATQLSPTFFTRKRLTTVTTRVLTTGTTYQNVDAWTLTHTFPDPGDGTNAALWLSRIGHKGVVGTAVTLPDVVMHGVQMANRVDRTGDAGPPMNRYRINAIDSESGSTTSVNYTPQDCTTESLPASADSNTRRCFPVTWYPEGTGGPITEYFHKYLAESVVADAKDTLSTATETHYSYVGDPAWRYDDNPLVPTSQRTWNQWRGYATVDVTTGAVDTPQRSSTRYRYFRGMDGDRLPGGGARSVQIDGLTDHDHLSGFVREEITYDGVGGAEVAGTFQSPWLSDPTATGSDGTTARFTGTQTTEARTTAPALPGGRRTTRTVTTFDPAYGVPTQVDDQGDISTAADDRCARTEYVRNATANLTGTVRRVETVGVGCAATASRPGDVISDVRTAYDGGAYGAVPTRGLVTTGQVLARYDGATPVYVTQSRGTYDALGRPLTATDVLNRTTTTAYTPAGAGPVTKTVVTTPDPDGAGAATALATTTTLNPAWGAATQETDANGKVTSATYDGLGRTTAVWLPGRAQASQSANRTFAYTVSATAADAITTKTLDANGAYVTAVELFDGLGRSRQTQSPSLSVDHPGRVVTDTVYDSRGLVSFSNGSWFTTGAPGTTLVQPTEAVPSRTRIAYDGAGRETAQITDVADQERWRTTTTYGGDRVTVVPPSGGVPRTTISDARGQTTELRQYLGDTATGAFEATTYAYDDAGRMTTVRDAAGNAWTTTYDLRGRKTGSVDPDKGSTTSTYDDAGQLLSTTDARGTTLAYAYDALGRKTSERQGSATGALQAQWTYDTLAKGQLTSTTRYAGGAAYVTAVTGYDAGYRPLGKSVTLPSAEGALAGTYTTGYTYTPDGQQASVKLPAAGNLTAETVTTHYDAANRSEWMNGSLGWGVYVADAQYSSYGQLLMQDLGNTTSNYISYDYEYGTQRLSKTWLVQDGVDGYDLDLSYTYDAAGNPTSTIDRPTDEPVDAQCYAYDGLNRLASAWTPGSGDCAAAKTVEALGGPAPYWTDYTFDLAGNRATDVRHTEAGATTRTYTYPAAGSPLPHAVSSIAEAAPDGTVETSSYAYDAIGSTTTRAIAGEAEQTLAWDAEGRLTGVTQAESTSSYVYTADGERLVRKQGGTTTVYLPGGQELTLTTATSTVTALRYYSFHGQTVAVRTDKTGSSVSSLVNDPHGTAELSIANATAVITKRLLDPYGSLRGAAADAWSGDHGFLDKPVDATGLVSVGARYYEPDVGRFISVDPVMELGTPQQWAAFAYGNNNPLAYSDPTGLVSTSMMIDGGRPGKRSSDRSSSSPALRTAPVQSRLKSPSAKPKASRSVRTLADASAAKGVRGGSHMRIETSPEGAERRGVSRTFTTRDESDSTEPDWGTLGAGIVNYGWGLFKVARGGGIVLLGASASVLGITLPAGLATMAYGAYDATSGVLKAAKGVRQIYSSVTEGVSVSEGGGWRGNSARFLWGTVPGGSFFDQKTDWLDKWGSLP